MFDSDKWLEIFTTMSKNPLRTALTGTSVALGVFILIVFQGIGFGLQNGVEGEFDDDAINSMWIRSNRTSMPYAGLQPNRPIQYKDDDLELIREKYGVNVYSGRYGRWGAPVSFENKTQNFAMRGVHSGHLFLEKTDITEGRFINEFDLAEERKVAVVGQTIVEDLFKGENPNGKFIKVFGIQFKVVGHYNDPASRWENRVVYLPLTTTQKLFGAEDELDMFIVSTGDMPFEETVEMREDIENILKAKHKVHPEDQKAIRINNNNESLKEYLDIFKGIRIFIWVMGGLTLIAGMIGVANIMSVTVKERTKEIGIRKALGATPGSILSMIVSEAIMLTLASGCIGFLVGWGILRVVSGFIEHDYFQNPQVNLEVSVVVIILLVIIGALAGLFPALNAAYIKPIKALREN
ncbi:MAG: ABC transporter permease [Flavobacteriales bacterium]|nr:ABC transporter permease [Flavobacteriales bacterium]